MKVAFLPIDNRPVCYTLPKLIAGMDDNMEFFIPNRSLLGDLTKSADVEELFQWLDELPDDIDSMVLSLDTIAYGGLIPSRRCVETFEQIKNRTNRLKDILLQKKCRIYAFSSIMRISNNNYNDEEKEYWSVWGKKIFEYSYNLHKTGEEPKNDIPKAILDDYLMTRKRNFEINKIYLNLQKEGLFDTLIFSKDDCAQFGLNVKEAQELELLGGFTKTGADEIPLSLLSRAIAGSIKICPVYTEPEQKNLISNYEDISVEKSVMGQIVLAGCKVSDEKDADIILYVNNFKNHQGEIVMNVQTEGFCGSFRTPSRPYMIADVRYANGSDNGFVEEVLKNDLKEEYFYGYSAWNTSANTLGSLICGAKIRYFAQRYNKSAFQKLQITRFLDDWAYQANIRQLLESPDVNVLTSKMKSYEDKVSKVFNHEVNVSYKYPWNRLFEVEIEFN